MRQLRSVDGYSAHFPGVRPLRAGLLAALAATGAAMPRGAAETTETRSTPAAAGAATTSGAAAAAATKLTAVARDDGAVEVRSGTTTIARVAVGTPPLRRGVAHLRETDVEGHRIAELRIPVRGHPAVEVWVADVGTKPPRIIWSGLQGPRDADEEAGIAVEVTPERIFEYQTAAHVTRCDGEPVRLFPRAWDFSSGKFRPILATAPPPAPATRKLTARRGDAAMPTGRPVGGFHFTAASTTAAAGTDARALAAPVALDDGDPKTAWMEGLGGDGSGEFLTARATGGRYRVKGLRIVPGDASSPAAWKSRNRIKSLTVAFGPEPERQYDVDLPEDPAAADGKPGTAYWAALPEPVETACLTVIVREVYRGTEARPAGGGGTTAIAALELFTELDDATGVQRLISDMAAGADCAARVPLLVGLGEPAVLPAAEAIRAANAARWQGQGQGQGQGAGPAAGQSAAGRACLVEVLSRIDATTANPVALNVLGEALAGASAAEERLITEVMTKAQRKTGKAPVAAIAALLSTTGGGAAVAAADVARAARLLGTLDSAEATAALLAAAGTAEQPETRAEIVQALGRSPGATITIVVSAIDATRRGGKSEAADRRAADLIRALPALARRTPAERPLAIESVRRALASSPSFEVRGRAILALGQIAAAPESGGGGGGAADQGVAGTLTPDLAAVRESSDDAVLRFLATRELGGVTGAAAANALRGALGDVDPRVREAAAQGLGSRRDAASEAVLIEAAKNEPWPFARRAQVEALSRTCGAPARELLVRATERDVDEVRRASLVGLVRCRDSRARPTLLAALKNRRAGAALRELSGALLGELGDRTVTKELADIVLGLVNEAEGDLAIEGVAITALRSLGQLGGADAARVAARLAADAQHPAYRRPAVESLGRICDPGVGAKALAIARAGADAGLALEAQKAEQRCK